jgi:hypothetical protein
MDQPFDVHAIYSLMRDNHIQFSYKGPITQDVLITLGDVIKDEMHYGDCDARVIKRVFSVLVEAAHNILKYSGEKTLVEDSGKSAGVGLIGIGKSGKDMFLVFSGNIVTAPEAEAIKQRLQHINSLSRDDLQKTYQKQLKEGTVTETGGAGLGLYEVARKSARPIEYGFHPLEDGLLFFEMKVYVRVEV